MRILFLTNIELARWRLEMIQLIAFALAAATTPAFAQNYQPYNPNAPQHYNNAPGLYAPGLTAGGPRTYPGPGGYPYWSGYVDAPVGQPIPPCYWTTQRFWDGHAWRVRHARICG